MRDVLTRLGTLGSGAAQSGNLPALFWSDLADCSLIDRRCGNALHVDGGMTRRRVRHDIQETR